VPNLEDVSPSLSSSVAQGGVADSAGGISYSGEAFDSTAGAVAFQGPTADFILYGVVNGAFAQGPPDPSQNIDPINNELPYWYGPVQVSGGAITCTWAADSSSPSGYNLRFTINAGAASDEAYVEQIVPIGATRGRLQDVFLRFEMYRVSATGGAPQMTVAGQFLTTSGATTGSAFTSTSTLSADSTLYRKSLPTSSAPPGDAAYLRIRCGVTRNTMAASDSAVLDLSSVRIDKGGGTVLVSEQTSQDTFAAGQIYQTDGSIVVAAESDVRLNAAGATGRIFLDHAYGVRIKEVAAPPTPGSGYYSIYPKTDGILYGKNDAGTETPLGGGGTISNALVMSNIISPTVAANTNNWAPAGFATAVGVSPDVTGATRTVTGFDSTGCTQGQAWLIMPRTNDLIIAAKSASSSVGNRVRCANATNKTIGNGGGAWMYYDPASDSNNPFVLITNA
jgi:hypothetical protein